MKDKQLSIKITVHKDHIFTLGEKMYGESIELIRELVNNAYDADATEVHIYITAESIIVEDNGSGMNEKGLAQFFVIGSQEKATHSLSPKFNRKRIGQFGIGKFAALSAADEFTVESRKGKWIYRVVFNREDWKKTDNWELPITKEPATPFDHQGTKVVLTKLRKKFLPKEIKKYLHQSIPLRAKKFVVYLNKERITKKEVVGRRVSVNIKTIYGSIEGEIIIALNAKNVENPGVVCQVKQVFIKKELFGLQHKFSHQLTNRICGEVNADFLPLLVSRSDFVRDSDEYRIFEQLMTKLLTKTLYDLKQTTKDKSLKKVSKQLRQVLDKVRDALELNPDFVPSQRIITRLKKEKQKASSKVRSQHKQEVKPEQKGQEKPAANLLKPEVSKRIRLKKLGVSVGIVSLGEEGPESSAEGNLIYINQDHPLYQKFYANQELFSLHLARLITKEIILMKKLRMSARYAYDFQSKLLTDVFVSKNKK